MEKIVVKVDADLDCIEVPLLGIGSDEVKMPHPIGSQADSYFVGGVHLVSTDVQVDVDGSPIAGRPIDVRGIFAAALFNGRMGLIVRDPSDQRPSFWLNRSVSDITATPIGTAGIVRKRPRSIEIVDGNTSALLEEVCQFFPVRRVMQARRSSNLLHELAQAGV